MSILAEPRRKQRISVDPNNLQWKNDDNKLSKKMMENMGWSEGKGLGKNKTGNVDFVKLKANRTGKGLGSDKLAGYDSTWIGHHDDFADLLAALNKNKPKEDETEEQKKERANKISIELSSKSVKRRIHYQKFTKMKDTANYTDKDKSAVLGIGLKRTKDESTDAKKTNSSDSDEGVSQGNTTVSNLSVGDYFAAKMAALKAKPKSCTVTVKEELIDVKEEVADDYEETVKNYTSIGFSYDKSVEMGNQNYNSIGFSYQDEPIESVVREEPTEIVEDEKTRRKREKKERKQKESELIEVKTESIEIDEEAERQKRKEEKRQRKLLKKQMEAEPEIKEEAPEEPEDEMIEEQRHKIEKRLKKKQQQEVVESEEQVVEVVKEKKKKKKRNETEIDEEEPKKKKEKNQ